MAAIVSLVSRHRTADGRAACRVLLEDDTMRVLEEAQAMRMPNGDVALARPNEFKTQRTEPQTLEQGPRIGSVIRVLIQGTWMSCVVRNAYPPSTPGEPVRYFVEYDDGMMVEDRLCVPWDFVVPAVTPQSAGAGCSSDALPEVGGFDAIVEAAAAMQAEAVVEDAEKLSSAACDDVSSMAGVSSPHSSHSGASMATDIVRPAASEVEVLEEADEANHDFEAIDLSLARLIGFKSVVYA